MVPPIDVTDVVSVETAQKAIRNREISIQKAKYISDALKLEQQANKKYRLVRVPTNEYEITTSDIKVCDPYVFLDIDQEGDYANVIMLKLQLFPTENDGKNAMVSSIIKEEQQAKELDKEVIKKLEKRIHVTIGSLIKKGYIREENGKIISMLEIK